ncbi:MAG: DNA-binding protein Alba [Candidatus Altiarchaeota archaeon]|nr:DNA-binding protein Alba [Candidatus Altiarchaeota archaeon]
MASAKKDGVVFIGTKPPMNYVLAVVTQFHNGAKEVHIKARGRAISRAADVSEIIKSRFMPDLKAGKIEITTEILKGENNEEIKVSAIDIPLIK